MALYTDRQAYHLLLATAASDNMLVQSYKAWR
jgi:hypothetical protein